MAEKIQKSFTAAMRDYFGFREGKTLQDFSQELRALTPQEKDWFKEQLETVGYEIVAPQSPS